MPSPAFDQTTNRRLRASLHSQAARERFSSTQNRGSSLPPAAIDAALRKPRTQTNSSPLAIHMSEGSRSEARAGLRRKLRKARVAPVAYQIRARPRVAARTRVHTCARRRRVGEEFLPPRGLGSRFCRGRIAFRGGFSQCPRARTGIAPGTRGGRRRRGVARGAGEVSEFERA